MSTENNKNSNSESDSNIDWKSRFTDLMNTCQSEIKKTTKIGMKMLSASQANSQLHETYELIGRWVVESVENGTLKVDDVEVEGFIAKIKELEKSLEGLEEEVQEIKKND